jgi:hypothetical protein
VTSTTGNDFVGFDRQTAIFDESLLVLAKRVKHLAPMMCAMYKACIAGNESLEG